MADPTQIEDYSLGAQNLEPTLAPSFFIDSDNTAVEAFADQVVGRGVDDIDRGVQLYYGVRDSIRYDPYDINCTPEGFRASGCLQRGRGFCIISGMRRLIRRRIDEDVHSFDSSTLSAGLPDRDRPRCAGWRSSRTRS